MSETSAVFVRHNVLTDALDTPSRVGGQDVLTVLNALCGIANLEQVARGEVTSITAGGFDIHANQRRPDGSRQPGHVYVAVDSKPRTRRVIDTPSGRTEIADSDTMPDDAPRGATKEIKILRSYEANFSGIGLATLEVYDHGQVRMQLARSTTNPRDPQVTTVRFGKNGQLKWVQDVYMRDNTPSRIDHMFMNRETGEPRIRIHRNLGNGQIDISIFPENLRLSHEGSKPFLFTQHNPQGTQQDVSVFDIIPILTEVLTIEEIKKIPCFAGAAKLAQAFQMAADPKNAHKIAALYDLSGTGQKPSSSAADAASSGPAVPTPPQVRFMGGAAG